MADPGFIKAVAKELAGNKDFVRANVDELEDRYRKTFTKWVVGVVLKLAGAAAFAIVSAAAGAVWVLTKIKLLGSA